MLIDLNIINRKSYFDIDENKSADNKGLSNNNFSDGEEPTENLLLQKPGVEQVSASNNQNNQNNQKTKDYQYWLDKFEERAAIMEYDGGLSRIEAETQALGELIDEWMESHKIEDRKLALEVLARHEIKGTSHKQ